MTATSSGNAWAVGSACMMCGSESQVTDTLTEHWNGTVWPQVSSPSPGNFSNDLHGVAATSATNAWAVGAEGSGTLAAQWNGSSWKQVPTPGSSLSAVTAPSSTNIWAVGFYSKGTLALHRC